MVDIPKVQAELCFPAEGVPSADLSPAGQSRTDRVSSGLLRRVALQVGSWQRPGADQTHITPKDIPEFREFVEAGCSEEPPPSRESLCVIARSVPHRSQFEDLERPSAAARPLLAKKDRASVDDAVCQAEAKERAAEHEGCSKGGGDIKCALHRWSGWEGCKGGNCDPIVGWTMQTSNPPLTGGGAWIGSPPKPKQT